MKQSVPSDFPLVTNLSDELFTCCDTRSQLIDNQPSSSNEISDKLSQKNDWTCARFYEEKIHSLLEIFSEVIEGFLFPPSTTEQS